MVQSVGGEPLDVPVHGPQGYKQGCRCLTCRRGHADKVTAYRERRKANGGGPLTDAKVVIPPGAGAFEIKVRKAVGAIGAKGEQADVLVDLLVFNSKLIDQIPDTGRWHLAQPAQRMILDLLKQLEALGPPKEGVDPGKDLGGFLGGLTKQGRRS